MRDGIERLIPQGCVPSPAPMSMALIKALGLEAKGFSAVSEGKEEAHKCEQVGLVRVQALFQEHQVELAQSRKHGGEGGKWVSSFRARQARSPKFRCESKGGKVSQAKGAFPGLAVNRDAITATRAYHRSITASVLSTFFCASRDVIIPASSRQQKPPRWVESPRRGRLPRRRGTSTPSAPRPRSGSPSRRAAGTRGRS